MAVWIDEGLDVVRPAEFAWPGEVEGAGVRQLPDEIPDRMVQMAKAAGEISVDREFSLRALRDWAANGSASAYVLGPEQVVQGSVARDTDAASAAAHFALARELHRTGHLDDAVEHFRQAHRLDPGNWTYKRQAWELASRVDGPRARFGHGPGPGREAEWPYDGDWLTDVRQSGAENYYRTWTP